MESILFLCTGNSCRSQMAEAWCRAVRYDRYRASSAGVLAQGLNPHMLTVMRELGLDPALHQRSKTVAELIDAGERWDLVVTVCGHAHEHCPLFPGPATQVVHVGFDDPPALAATAADAAEALSHYRRVRDQIRDFILGLPGSLPA